MNSNPDDSAALEQAPPASQEIDQARLYGYLRAYLPEPEKPFFAIKRLPFGNSNLTYRVQFGRYDLVLRRPPIGANVKSGHDMEREYRILAGTAPLYSKIPRPVLFSDDLSVMGSPFYLMERVEGVILRDQVPAGLEITPSLMERLSEAFIENLATIHGLDYTTTSLKDLARPGGYVERQVKGWLDRYARARTDDRPNIERLGRWLEENRPPDTAPGLIHNDYKYDNIILDAGDLTRIKAVLDWEMATIGDPWMDLGTTLGYWIEPDDPEDLQTTRPQATLWPGNFNRAQLVQSYIKHSGREPANIVFYFVYGLFKIAVIVQQIYARYLRGLIPDRRYDHFPKAIQALGDAGILAIEKKRIDGLTR